MLHPIKMAVLSPKHPTPFQDAAVPLTGCTPARRGSPPALPCAPQRRREGHQDGGQLRHAGHGRGLCAPHRPHRARRGERPRRQLLHGRQRAPRAAGAPPPPSHLTCPQGSRLRACIMGDGCGIWSLARCVKLGLESCKVCGVQVLDILAEAQQPVPEQLRQYASVAGGGGGGAQFPHAQLIAAHVFLSMGPCQWARAPPMLHAGIAAVEEPVLTSTAVWASRFPESRAGRRRRVQRRGFWRSRRIQALITAVGLRCLVYQPAPKPAV